MNDSSEVEYGLRSIVQAYRYTEEGSRFRLALENILPNIVSTIEIPFDRSTPMLKDDTYLVSLSEHPKGEDCLGRLSMWRAYGKNCGVAIVMDPKKILDGPGVLDFFASPVEYFDDKEMALRLGQIAENINSEFQFLKSLPKERLSVIVQNMMRMAALSTKHPGFKEEREWGVIHSNIFTESHHLERGIESINGIPQTVLKIPLEDLSDGTQTGADLPGLIEKIIIGPTQYASVVKKALTHALATAGAERAEGKVFISGIPLR